MKRTITLLLTGLLAMTVVWLLYSNWGTLLKLIVEYQREFHRLLSQHIRTVANDPAATGWPLIGIAFLYGVFHAAGPGHGKAVLLTYLSTHRETLRQGVVISLLAALLQSLIAIGLIGVLVVVLNMQFKQAQAAGMQVEQIGYSLVILLGLWLVLRALWSMWRTRRQPAAHEGHDHSAEATTEHEHDGAHCDHHFAPTRKLNVWQMLSVIVSMGMRPCSGAIVVMIYAQLTGVLIYGIAATLVIGLGTGLTVALLAVVSVLARDWLSRNLAPEHHHHHTSVSRVLSLIGGLLLVWLGWGLLQLTLQVTQSHPLL